MVIVIIIVILIVIVLVLVIVPILEYWSTSIRYSMVNECSSGSLDERFKTFSYLTGSIDWRFKLTFVEAGTGQKETLSSTSTPVLE